jgi:hypothetical protein
LFWDEILTELSNGILPARTHAQPPRPYFVVLLNALVDRYKSNTVVVELHQMYVS